jgi:hypothetical protein
MYDAGFDSSQPPTRCTPIEPTNQPTNQPTTIMARSYDVIQVQSMEITPDGVMWIIDAGMLNLFEPEAFEWHTPQLILVNVTTAEVLHVYQVYDGSVDADRSALSAVLQLTCQVMSSSQHR